MSDHYYDYGPRRLLEHPLVLSGFFGSHPEQVGHSLCALTGLPSLNLARLVEHKAGCKLSELLSAKGLAGLSALEAECLAEQLPRQPFPVISLAESTIVNTRLINVMSRHAQHLHLKTSLVESFWRVRREMAKTPQRYAPFLLDMPARPNDLQVLFAARATGYRAADRFVPVAGLDSVASARAVLSALDLN